MFNISPYGNIVILTGAGISAESGLTTFRDKNGLWANYKIEDVCTPDALEIQPHIVHEFYNLRRRELLNPEIAPNSAHFALAELQEKWRGNATIITQNIDDLHERSGSKKVIHMHGELLKTSCRNCYSITESKTDCDMQTPCNTCGIKAMRPHVVFFGENIYASSQINMALHKSDMFVSIGTSGNVMPAASYALNAKQRGKPTVEINLEKSKHADVFSDAFYGAATIEVPKFVNKLLSMPKL